MPDNSFDTLGLALSQLSKELDQVEKDTTLLAQFSGSQDEHRQFADSIREQHLSAKRLAEQLHLELEYSADAQKSSQTTQLNQITSRMRKQQREFRGALLKYKGNSLTAAKKERELLLSGAATPSELRKRKARTGNAVLNAATDVTTALQETVSMMNEEIEKSAKNITALQDSSNTLRKTKEEHLTLDGIMKTSANLIKSLEQADAMDRWIMLGGLVLFSLVVFNILRKRIWIPGLSTLFSVLRYMLVGGSSKATSAVTSPMVMATPSTELVSNISNAAVASVAQVLVATTSAVVAKEILTTATPVPVSVSEEGALGDDTTLLEHTVSTEGIAISSEDLAPEDGAVASDGLVDEPEHVDEPTTTTTSQYEQQEPPAVNFRRKNIYTMPVVKPVREEL